MRLFLALTLVLPLVGSPIACGGAAADGGGAASPGPGPSSAANASIAASADAGPATTTTTTLGAGGDLQGAKLTQTTTVASTTGSAAPAPASSGPHTHDTGRTLADFKAIMAAHRDEARACYDLALPTHPGIEGDLVIQLTIDPKGSVTQASLDSSRSTLVEPSVVACVTKVLQRVQFAASPGGYETRTTFPYNFKPRAAKTSTP